MKYKDYVKLQEQGSAWTSALPYRQFLLKDGINWMIMNFQDTPCKILDLGCGDGWGTKYMKDHLPDTFVIGGDISKPKVEMAKLKGVDARFMDMHKLEGMYDVIYCSHSLEHSYNIKKALNSILDHLTIEGKLYLIVPIEPNIKEIADGSHIQVIKKDSDVLDIIKERKDVVVEFTGHTEREVFELWLIVRKIK